VARWFVLDIRPVADEPEVWVRDRSGGETRCGGLTWVGDGPVGHAQASAAVDQILNEGWFAAPAPRRFEWVDVFDDADDLIECVSEEWEHRSVGEETSLRLVEALSRAGRGAAPFIRQGIQAQLLRKVRLTKLV